MPLIYIPQGHCGRMEIAINELAVSGFYTDDFSSCCIIIASGGGKIVMIHADSVTSPELIEQELAWLGGGAKVHLFSRPMAEHPIRDNFFEQLSKVNGLKVSKAVVDEGCRGISISLKDIGRKTQVQLVLERERPNNLLHHPNEREITIVRKIRQFIGMRAVKDSGMFPAQNICLFLNAYWLPAVPEEMRLDDPDPLTREELSFFSGDQTYGELLHSVEQGLFPLLEASDIPFQGDRGELAAYVAEKLENYFGNYQRVFLFKRNMVQVLQSALDLVDASDLATINYLVQLKDILGQDKLNIPQFSIVAAETQDKGIDNDIAIQVDAALTVQKRNYQSRDVYFKQKKEVAKQREFLQQHVATMAADPESATSNKANVLMGIAVKYFTADEPTLHNIVFMLARCHKNEGDLIIASKFYKLGQWLMKTYASSATAPLAALDDVIDPCQGAPDLGGPSGG